MTGTSAQNGGPAAIAPSRQAPASQDVTFHHRHITTATDIHRFLYMLVIVIGGILASVLFAGSEFSSSLKLIFLALLVLTLKRWTGALLLAMVQVHLFLSEPRLTGVFSGLTNVVPVVLLMTLIMAVSRFRTLTSLSETSIPAMVLAILRGTSGSAPPGMPLANTGPSARNTGIFDTGIRQVLLALLLFCGCFLAARAVLFLVPEGTTLTGLNTIAEYRLRPGGYRLLVLGLLLFAGYLLTWLLINEGFWRRLSKGQAGIYLRSTMTHWLSPDLRSIILRRLRAKRRKSVTVKNVVSGTTDDIPTADNFS
ncbi:MAG: hypothetical protein KDA81_15775 [Planctomycetaceae bacterium]|nr:hypothetical protein [Planctomycetaceae bacterium]